MSREEVMEALFTIQEVCNDAVSKDLKISTEQINSDIEKICFSSAVTISIIS